MLETLFASPVALFDRHPVTYLNAIWSHFFADVPRVNTVEILYKRSWKRKLGTIRLSRDGAISRIDLNGLLSLPDVPLAVLVTTVAHELVHYAHGFGSPLPQRYEHPHAHGVVTRELEKRGLGEVQQQCQAWLNQSWFSWWELRVPGKELAEALPIDMSVPPTAEQCFVLDRALQQGRWYHPTPVPLTEQEALWLRGYVSDCFSHRVQIDLDRLDAPLEDGQRTFALTLSYQQFAPLTIASFPDWRRVQRWAAVPAHFHREATMLSREHHDAEWERIQHLRALIFAVAQGGRERD